MIASNRKSAIITALFWFVFTATATFCAFVLPIHIWALINGYSLNTASALTNIYFFTLVFCALFHSFYRIRTICLDLGAHKSRIRDLVLCILFIFIVLVFTIS